MSAFVDGDRLRQQRRKVADLAEFLAEHAPDKPTPLPAVHWRIGTLPGFIFAEAFSSDTEPSNVGAYLPAVVKAYADALGVEVKIERLRGKTRYFATGRIDRREGTAQGLHTSLQIHADVEDEEGAEGS